MSSERDRETTDGGYVHRPGGQPSTSEPEPQGFGSQGWVLVAVLTLSFLVIPGIIYLRPSTPAAFGLPYLASFLVLPLLPAVLLGFVAVWSMTVATGRDDE
ncbi:MAG: hypothetical protein ACQETI_00395 [Halobacteriota archaeon]